MNSTTEIASPGAASELRSNTSRIAIDGPLRDCILLGIALVVLYMHTIVDAAKIWLVDDRYTHGFLIVPICAGLIWMMRDEFRDQPIKGSKIGILFLSVAVAIHTVARFFTVRYIDIWSIPLAVCGVIFLVFGKNYWRILAFPVVFLVALGPVPHFILEPITKWVQSLSTTGAYHIASALGFAVIRDGNLIQVPGMTLEVADACSGVRKLIALMTFSCLYAFMYRVPLWIRCVVVLATLPISIIANALRIAALTMISSYGGMQAFHSAHTISDYIALMFAMWVLVTVGGYLGCRNLRFQSS